MPNHQIWAAERLADKLENATATPPRAPATMPILVSSKALEPVTVPRETPAHQSLEFGRDDEISSFTIASKPRDRRWKIRNRW